MQNSEGNYSNRFLNLFGIFIALVVIFIVLNAVGLFSKGVFVIPSF